jgi:hypothetical protein
MVSDLTDRIESREFLRRVAEARRRYGGRPDRAVPTVDCQPDDRPDAPKRAEPDKPPAAKGAPGSDAD